MKRTLTALVCIFTIVSAAAQSRRPTSMWPYLYEDFRSGEVIMADGGSLRMRLNIHLRHAQLHYLKEDIIHEADPAWITSVCIGDERFVPLPQGMAKILIQKDSCVVAELAVGDFASLRETGGAYGSSSVNSATRRLSSVDGIGEVGKSQVLLQQKASEGVELDLLKTLWVICPAFSCRATSAEVAKSLPPEIRVQWKGWLKANKIRWNSPESIIQIADFLNR